VTQPAWLQLTVEASQEVRVALALLLTEWGAGGVVEEARSVSAYFTPADRGELDARLGRYAEDLGQAVGWSWSAVAEGWEDAWKVHFRPAVLSRRLAVCPSWEGFRPEDPEVRVIRMDPGRAFGTGTHETTRLCLGLLDDFIGGAPPPTLLDVGCGSGILAIGALLLGIPRAVALDIDPLAASATRENALHNGVADGLLVLCGDLRSVTGTYPLVVANILYQVLLGLAPTLAARVAPGGLLVLSGMLTPELASAAAVYQAQGLRESLRATAGEWGALVLQRPPRG